MTRTLSVALGLAAALVPAFPAIATDGLLARRVATPKLPIDARASQWRQAPVIEVGILPQTVATPQQAMPAVDKLRVRALHNGAEIAFLIEWQDRTMDDLPRTGIFSDAVAVELPLDGKGETSPMMGAGGPQHRVNILQWRADWQREIDKGETTVRTLFPNAVNDAETSAVYKHSDRDLYSPSKVIGNIVAQGPHAQPIIDLMAEGFGSLTPRVNQNACGKGVWDKGTWRVVICRPLANTVDHEAAPLSPGRATSIGFAVWNGSHGERGARKGWAPWVPLTIEK